MSPVRALRAFLRAPGARRRLALEALAELARARVVTWMPARVYTADLGVLAAANGAGAGGDEAAASEAGTQAGEDDHAERAAEIGRVVAGVARAMPFRALCLQQAIAVRRMLRRRGMTATVLLGISHNRRQADKGNDRGRVETAAHAWVTVGARVINGDGDLGDYTVVARFN